jgi:hypothetical protein
MHACKVHYLCSFLCYQLLGSSSGCSFVETSHHIITWLTYQDGFPKNLSLIYYLSWQLLQSTLAVSSGAGETSQTSVTDHMHVPVWSTGQFDSVIWCCNMVLYSDVIWWCYLVLLYHTVIWHCYMVLLYGDVMQGWFKKNPWLDIPNIPKMLPDIPKGYLVKDVVWRTKVYSNQVDGMKNKDLEKILLSSGNLFLNDLSLTQITNRQRTISNELDTTLLHLARFYTICLNTFQTASYTQRSLIIIRMASLHIDAQACF